jgi:hypothetical protein
VQVARGTNRVLETARTLGLEIAVTSQMDGTIRRYSAEAKQTSVDRVPCLSTSLVSGDIESASFILGWKSPDELVVWDLHCSAVGNFRFHPWPVALSVASDGSRIGAVRMQGESAVMEVFELVDRNDARPITSVPLDFGHIAPSTERQWSLRTNSNASVAVVRREDKCV